MVTSQNATPFGTFVAENGTKNPRATDMFLSTPVVPIFGPVPLTAEKDAGKNKARKGATTLRNQFVLRKWAMIDVSQKTSRMRNRFKEVLIKFDLRPLPVSNECVDRSLGNRLSRRSH